MAGAARGPRPLPLPWEDNDIAMCQAELSGEADEIALDWIMMARARRRRSTARHEAMVQVRAWRARAEMHDRQALYMTESWGQA